MDSDWIKGKADGGLNTGSQGRDDGFQPRRHWLCQSVTRDTNQKTPETPIYKFLAVFNSPYRRNFIERLATHAPPELVAQHLNVDEATVGKFIKSKQRNRPV